MIEVRNNHSPFDTTLDQSREAYLASLERYVLSGSLDGFEIRERGVVISRFEGTDLTLPKAHLRRLQEAARSHPLSDAGPVARAATTLNAI